MDSEVIEMSMLRHLKSPDTYVGAFWHEVSKKRNNYLLKSLYMGKSENAQENRRMP